MTRENKRHGYWNHKKYLKLKKQEEEKKFQAFLDDARQRMKEDKIICKSCNGTGRFVHNCEDTIEKLMKENNELKIRLEWIEDGHEVTCIPRNLTVHGCRCELLVSDD